MKTTTESRPEPLTVDEWVEKLKGLEQIGEMSHWQRVEKAFNLEEPDIVPVIPQLDYWQQYDVGYTQQDLSLGPDIVKNRTDGSIRAWARYRTDALSPYIDDLDLFDTFVPPEEREAYLKKSLRGPRDHCLALGPLHSLDLDGAIRYFQDRPWEDYPPGRGTNYSEPHFQNLLEFQTKMSNVVSVICGVATPVNLTEDLLEVQKVVKWTVTKPKEKLRDLFGLVTQIQIEALYHLKEMPHGSEIKIFHAYGGARTWGPRQINEFIEYEEVFLERARRLFPHIMWHQCGGNVRELVEWATKRAPGVDAIIFDTPLSQYNMTWPEWYEYIARMARGRRCAASCPTTQVLMYESPEEIRQMVKTYIKAVTPHTTAIVMTPCAVGGYTPRENLRAMIEAARVYGRYPIKV